MQLDVGSEPYLSQHKPHANLLGTFSIESFRPIASLRLDGAQVPHIPL